MNAYTTVLQAATAEFVEKRSRFIGAIWPVQTPDAAAKILEQVRAQYWDATHNCYAYNLRGGVQRYSDDGEPQATAGIPILEILRKEQVVDALIVVTRYFGGTLLGAGGLVRAYSHAAKLALQAGEKRVMQPCALFSITLGYGLYNKIEPLLQRHNALVQASDFAENVTLTLRLVQANVPGFCGELTEFSGGGVTPVLLGEEFA